MLRDGMLVRTQYLNVLNDLSGNSSVVKIVTGMRGVGKTTLMNQYAEGYPKEHKLTVLDYDFDSMSCFGIRTAEELRMHILADTEGMGLCTIILHEVQKIPGWAPVIADLIPKNIGEFFVTASDDSVGAIRKLEIMKNSVVEIQMTPLSLREFMEMNNFRSPKVALGAYLKVGGLPMVRAGMDPSIVRSLLNGLMWEIVLKDVLPYGKGFPAAGTAALARHIMADSGANVNTGDLSDTSGSSVHNSTKILDAMKGCYMIFGNENRSFLSKITKINTVYYAADIGFRLCLKDYRPSIQSLGDNLLMIELKRLGYNVIIEGSEDKRSFTAVDDEGSTVYSIVAQGSSGKISAKRIVISMDEGCKTGFTLSQFLSAEAE